MILPTSNFILTTTTQIPDISKDTSLIINEPGYLLWILIAGCSLGAGIILCCLTWLCVICKKSGYSLPAVKVYNLPNLKFRKGECRYNACTQCFVHYKNNEKLKILNCGHTFHRACLRDYVRYYETPNCPICLEYLYPKRTPGSKNLVGTLVTDKDPINGKKLNYGTILV